MKPKTRHFQFASASVFVRFEVGFLTILTIVLLAASALAQEVRVQIPRGPYYVGEPIDVQIVVSDFKEDPSPEIFSGTIPGGQLRFVSVSPSTSTSITFVNGKMTRRHEVTFVYRYTLTGTRKGSLQVPPFTVTQATTSRSTRGFSLEIVGVPETSLVGIELEIPEGPILVGQKVPIAIEFRIDRETQRDLVSYEVHVPLFDTPTLRFLDEPPARTDTHLEIQTEAGLLRLPAVSSERRIRGRPTLIVRAERTMIAISRDDIRADASKVFISKGIAFRRDMFNRRRAASTKRFVATGKPIRIEVAEVPRVGRPPSFAGAVGSGYSLEVDADRSVVQLGEPIMLTFHLRGDGDLSSASLPALDAEGLFDSTRFRLPEESPAGLVDESGKHFEVTLRVLDAGVREIPALAYSWYNADTRQFETTYSRPIALSVGAAEIIGADSVARRRVMDPAVADEDPSASPPRGADGKQRSTKMSLTGANLAVDVDTSRLLRITHDQGQDFRVTVPLYSAGVAFLALAGLMARRRAADPLVRARVETLRRTEKAIDQALARSDGGGPAALGRALREWLAALPGEANADLDQLIAECDALRFAPAPLQADPQAKRGPELPPALADRARRLIAARLKSDRGSGEAS